MTTKVTPEFKRAFKHFMDGAGRLGLLDDTDVIQMQTAFARGDMAYIEDDEDGNGIEAARTHGYRDGLAAAYRPSIALLRERGTEITVETVRGLLDRFAKMMADAQRTYGAQGLLLMPPVWPELAGSDAERQAMEAVTCDYWHSTARVILHSIGDYTEDDDSMYSGLFELAYWVESACAYWAMREDMRRNGTGNGEARKLYNAYLNAMAREHGEWVAEWEAKNGRKIGDWNMPYESLQDVMTAFCAAYSHGIDPYTGERPTLRNIA